MSNNLYIVPYDFTPVADKALAYALHLGGKVNAEIRVIHLAASKAKGMPKVQLLEDVKNRQNIPHGVELTTKVRVGSIFTDISKIAKEESAQLIIMGTHGSRGLQSMFGSHAMKVITSADCPFIIVQKHTKIVDVKSIVVPIDLTKESLQIVSLAGDLAKMFNAEVHVIAEKQSDQILNTRIQNRIGLVKKQYEETEVKAQINMVKNRGSYGKKVTEYFKKNNNDIVAIAYHSESLFPQFDSFAQNLITNKAGLPVMVINSKLASALYF